MLPMFRLQPRAGGCRPRQRAYRSSVDGRHVFSVQGLSKRIFLPEKIAVWRPVCGETIGIYLSENLFLSRLLHPKDLASRRLNRDPIHHYGREDAKL